MGTGYSSPEPNTTMIDLSSKQLEQAAKLKGRIEKLQGELAQLLGGSTRTSSTTAPRKRRSKMSAAARAKISAAQKARWAKQKGAKQ